MNPSTISIDTEAAHTLINMKSLDDNRTTTKLPELSPVKKKPGRKPKKTNMSHINESNVYVRQHLETNKAQLTVITKLCEDIYNKFQYSGKEHHYQAALEEELRDYGFHTQQEVARLLHYEKNNNDVIQLPHDIRGREDIVLHKNQMIVELKQTGKLTDKEFNQICRYIDERQRYTNWGNHTRGMLINFGDNDLEIWYLFFDMSQTGRKIVRVQICKKEKTPLASIIDTYTMV